jgi:AraC family transcriptional regulator of adaptative response/methylated-DNA-[protein]-cysteine methyltransferase
VAIRIERSKLENIATSDSAMPPRPSFLPQTKAPANDTPSWARPRPKEPIHYTVGKSPLGPLLVALSETGVVAISLGGDAEELIENLQRRFPKAEVTRDDHRTSTALKRVIAYMKKPVGPLDLPLDLRGTAFQKRVWEEVRRVLPGQTSSYTEIARRIGADQAVRAVGTACASNLLALAIPCHRVLRKDGTFAGGTFWQGDRHRLMLAREAAVG